MLDCIAKQDTTRVQFLLWKYSFFPANINQILLPLHFVKIVAALYDLIFAGLNVYNWPCLVESMKMGILQQVADSWFR